MRQKPFRSVSKLKWLQVGPGRWRQTVALGEVLRNPEVLNMLKVALVLDTRAVTVIDPGNFSPDNRKPKSLEIYGFVKPRPKYAPAFLALEICIFPNILQVHACDQHHFVGFSPKRGIPQNGKFERL